MGASGKARGMLLLRDVARGDLGGLKKLAATLNSVNLPNNAKVLAGLPSGGTNCSAPLRQLNGRSARAELVVLVSDNQSWVDGHGGGRSTASSGSSRSRRAKIGSTSSIL